jgi:hypothetical protein
MHVKHDDMHAGILLGEVVVEHLAHREVRRDRVVDVDAGQFEHFRAREELRRVAVHRPDDVDDAVANLADQLRRRATERHRGIDLDLDAALRVLHHAVRPGL